MLPASNRTEGTIMHSINRRHAALGVLGAALLLSQTAPGFADNWPSRQITMIVPFTAGTTSDVIARGLARETASQ